MSEYQVCKRCVMDSTEKIIHFDENGFCDYCTEALARMPKEWHKDGEKEMAAKFEEIKRSGQGKKYDCIIGISGGIDSSFVAYLGHKYGVRMLGVHVDAGWNTEISSRNVKLISEKYLCDLEIIKINDKEMMDLQRAYFLSGVPNQDVPQDHAFFSALLSFAIKNNIKWVLDGCNFASESILGKGMGYDAKDAVNLCDIHAHYGQVPLKDFPLMEEKLFYRDLYRKKLLLRFSPLQFVNYNPDQAIECLHKDCGFEYYGGKHHESRFTRLFQDYIQPVKFKTDKRRSHLSSLIIANLISRDEALAILSKPGYESQDEQEADITFFINRIGLSRTEFDRCMTEPYRLHSDFRRNKYNRRGYQIFRTVLGKLKRMVHSK